MNKNISDSILELITKLAGISKNDKKAFLGFDACIDYIVRVVREKKENETTEYFSDSDQFGNFLLNLNKKSCGLELKTKLSKIGGNMVITGNSLANLGVKVECLGTFGFPDILPVFRTMSENCNLLTIGETISATALEFDNSKVIMFDPGPYDNLTWEGIKELLGVERIKQLITGKQLVALVNWSEIENSSQIWQGILDEILPYIRFNDSKPSFFTDFSDCSRKSKSDILFAFSLLVRFKKYFRVLISLNQNEADLIANALDVHGYKSDEEFVKALYHACNTDVLIIHRTKDALAYDGTTYGQSETFFCKEPRILTGGGDNFNAGFCYTLFNDFTLFESLVVANAVSGSYVKTGISPGVDDLIDFLRENLTTF